MKTRPLGRTGIQGTTMSGQAGNPDHDDTTPMVGRRACGGVSR
ncbi:hypothetical protein ACFY05_16800 [Microtetraspora fusca]|uniref:Uncharacterized protein n=1 Tax=Microtetraspora fusca TaxID=1997 RepID=A0ABW6V7E4_MICFU